MTKFNKILICGSSYLTRDVVNYIKPHYNLVGYVPSKSHVFSTDIDLPKVDFDVEYDIIVSVQYDRKIADIKNSYNLHTGLLPEWGGTDILYHTLKSNVKEQGLTFHKINETFDGGQIISKVSYPVFEDDSMLELYNRARTVAPNFTLASLRLLETLSNPELCYKQIPTIYKRGEIDVSDLNEYHSFPDKLKSSMIRLRKLTEDDLEFLLEIRNHSSTRNVLANTSIFTLEDSKKWYSNLEHPYYIIENELGERVGYIRTNGDEVGCDIHMDYRRRGYARKAYKEYLKNKDYASLYVLETNFAINLYRELGFVETGNSVTPDERGKHLEMIWKRK